MIFLSQFKGNTHQEICEAIRTLNEKFLTSTHIQQILQFIPSKQDVIEIYISIVEINHYYYLDSKY